MQDKLRALEQRYEALTAEMANPEVIADYHRLTALSKERAQLEEVVSLSRALRENEEQIVEARALAFGNDADMAALAKEELDTLEP